MNRLNRQKIYLLSFTLLSVSWLTSQSIHKSDSRLWEKALRIHQQAIVIDTHCDTPMLLLEQNLNIGKKLTKNDVDFIRMKEGGVDAAFFAVFISNKLDNKHPSKRALSMIDEIYNQVEKNSNLAEMAFSVQDIKNIEIKGKRAILIGMENGGPIEGSLRLLRDYYRLGVRYITLTHSRNNHICDSSTDKKSRWQGLSPFGKQVVTEMNRLGMMIDVSHISDQAFWDVLKTSRAPVFASHSCVRSLCQTARNMSDEMIKALAAKGGVIQINFYAGFLDKQFKKQADAVDKKLEPKYQEIERKFQNNRSKYWNALFELWAKHAPASPDIHVLIDHIDYVVNIAGIDYVGLGSDFDGAGSFPKGLEDISKFPLITFQLLKRGYKENEIKKILGGNFLRVMAEVEKIKQII